MFTWATGEMMKEEGQERVLGGREAGRPKALAGGVWHAHGVRSNVKELNLITVRPSVLFLTPLGEKHITETKELLPFPVQMEIPRPRHLSDTTHTQQRCSHPIWHSFMPSFTCKYLRTFQRQDTTPFSTRCLFHTRPTLPVPFLFFLLNLASTWGPFLKSSQPNISPYFCSSLRNSSWAALLLAFF